MREHGRRWRPQVSISFKLVGFTAIAIAAIAGVLTYYFQSQHVAALAVEENHRAEIYGHLLANELRSAVAFSDRETAREVLTPLGTDPDVSSTTLFGADGTVIYETGKPSRSVATRRGAAQEIVDSDELVTIVMPVVSLEGPRGTLVIEMTKERLTAQQRRVEQTAFLVGVGALVFGVIAAWAIARSLVRRLRRIGRVAAAVTAGDYDHEMAAVDSADEIGVLAAGFNAMLAQLREANKTLESRVDRRASELSRANAALQSEMERRTAMELELRQAQKLESVGRLAAGVAHEINTPVQFAADSCSFLGDAITDLVQGFDARRKVLAELAAGQISIVDATAAIDASDEQFDVSYLVQQIPKAVVRVKQGCERVAKIVAAMKEFAYADQTTQAPADLNRAIESTLVVANNEYKYVADVETNLGELPAVVCHLSELNQVFLNIVVNAAHAIEGRIRGTDKRGKIKITTAIHGEDAVIEIADDGCGIPSEIIEKIFDPFFTTKEIGKGTGQGLAIARSVVVDKHHGKLTVASTPDAGTTFTIRLPIAGHGHTDALQEAA